MLKCDKNSEKKKNIASSLYDSEKERTMSGEKGTPHKLNFAIKCISSRAATEHLSFTRKEIIQPNGKHTVTFIELP